LLVGAVLPTLLSMGKHGGALGALQGQVRSLWVATGLGELLLIVAGVVVLICILKVLLLV